MEDNSAKNTIIMIEKIRIFYILIGFSNILCFGIKMILKLGIYSLISNSIIKDNQSIIYSDASLSF
jgi:hypothetical protein